MAKPCETRNCAEPLPKRKGSCANRSGRQVWRSARNGFVATGGKQLTFCLSPKTTKVPGHLGMLCPSLRRPFSVCRPSRRDMMTSSKNSSQQTGGAPAGFLFPRIPPSVLGPSGICTPSEAWRDGPVGSGLPIGCPQATPGRAPHKTWCITHRLSGSAVPPCLLIVPVDTNRKFDELFSIAMAN